MPSAEQNSSVFRPRPWYLHHTKKLHPGQGVQLYRGRRFLTPTYYPTMTAPGKVGDGNIKIAIAVEIPPELLKSIFRWVVPIILVLSQHHIF